MTIVVYRNGQAAAYERGRYLGSFDSVAEALTFALWWK
jgi:hypothetical protein